MFHGSMVALVTPMKADGTIDYAALERLVDWHLEQETDGLVIMGTTGESPTVQPEERRKIIKQVVSQVKQERPVIVGSGTNVTAHSIELTREAMEQGADAALLVTPYYNKPTQEGLFQHYQTVAKAVPIPIILYNVPARTGCDLLPETVQRLDAVANIVGVKEASGKVERVGQMLNLGCQLDIFSGNDDCAMEFMLAGAKGVISVAANIVPNLFHQMCQAALKKDQEAAKAIDDQLQPLYQQLTVESNPIPAKWALAEMKKIELGIRLPLTQLNQQYYTDLRDVLMAQNLL